jgi:protein-S-isoprenylcysteine O-methyltransferase Ste14
MRHRSSPDWHAVRIGGVLAFAGSLGYFAWRYATSFGEPIDPASPILRPVAINVALFTLFAGHHSLFARARFKSLVEARVPEGLERSVYVWIASALFAIVAIFWQPVPGVFWHVTGAASRLFLLGPLAGVAIALAASRSFSARALAGLTREPSAAASSPNAASVEDSATRPSDRGPYAVVRHPLYVAVLLAVWPVATMTGTRLCFAILTTIYVLVAMPFEERDLRAAWGAGYDDYARRVRARLVPFVY